MKTRNKDGTFPKNHIPWNKELKGIHLSEKSEFKKGQFVGKDHNCWKGGIQYNANDCVYLNTGANTRIRRPRAVYMEHFGEIPPNYVIWHKDGNCKNDDPSNLEAISRREMADRNR